MPEVDFGYPPHNKVIVATCNLNQWALDFDGNLTRVEKSIRQAKSQGARFRVGPELELSGLAALLQSDATDDILCDIGMPVLHDGVRYNCRVFCLDRKILLIRPKAFLANDGNYHEARFFCSWKGRLGELHSHVLGDELRAATGQTTVPIGMGIIQTAETKVAAEVCEELWCSSNPHIDMALSGVEIFSNGSGSHHQLRKLESRLQLMMSATVKCGGAYVYSNHKGCDGTRLYFDGSSLICVNGEMKAQAAQFSLTDVEVVCAVVDLNDIRAYRSNIASLQDQASNKQNDNFCLSDHAIDATSFSLRCPNLCHPPTTTASIQPFIHSPEEECALGPACWLWDYLRRSNAVGFFLPLSGGADSASVATIVRIMCELAVRAASNGDQGVLTDLHTTAGHFAPFAPHKKAADKLCSLILHTAYMGTENSSEETNSRAQRLAGHFGAYHSSIVIDDIIASMLNVFGVLTGGVLPKFAAYGGTKTQDLALQNIQARLRMVMSYMLAQLIPWIRQIRSDPIQNGFLLVLGSGNVDEALRGYLTKYDCSSADLNPIGGICKNDLKRLLLWGEQVLQCPTLGDIVNAQPTAELQPLAGAGEEANDEDDMGMTYAELGVFGFLRKVQQCGPLTMFYKLCDMWGNTLNPSEIAAKVKRFFLYYSINRHKLTTLTPSYHAENYSPDDNRFDLRPILYNTSWRRQFNNIDAVVQMKEGENAVANSLTELA
eukprot:GSChrysophyteH2.ASY1.ANO1.842.1 assembled CDS